VRYGEVVTAAQLRDTLLRDLPYYKKSGGGVTFSGGEPLLHPGYLVELLPLLQDQGIHVAIESCAYADYERQIVPLIPLVDLWMIDIKAMDDERHLVATGKPVTPILDNIRRLSRDGADVLIRVPVVTGVNDDEQTMRDLAEFLTLQTDIRCVELLKMHKLAAHKYAALRRSYPAEHISVPDDVCLPMLARTLAACGIRAVWGEQTFHAE
jgi:pyruvate formate lyase activating enzyme